MIKEEKLCFLGILVAFILMGLMLYFGEIKHYDLIAKIFGFAGLIVGVISVNSLFIFALPAKINQLREREAFE